MNYSYDQRYISIEFTIERNHKMISMHFIEFPRIKTLTSYVGQFEN